MAAVTSQGATAFKLEISRPGTWTNESSISGVKVPIVLKNGSRTIYQRNLAVSCSASDPILVQAAKGEKVSRPPAWMMRQAGRYMESYRQLAKKHPDFRERSETTDLIVEITLQPWKAFRPDGVILFSDILTPLPAIGIPFEIDDHKGPLIDSTITSTESLSTLHSIDLSKVSFVAESLQLIRSEVGNGAAVLGFVGSPWTLATYCVEGKSSHTYTTIKTMAFKEPTLLHGLLSHLAEEIGTYANFQIESGAQCIQMFDSWGGQLPPHQWEKWSKPYLEQIIRKVRAAHPEVPLVLYANGSGGLLERIGSTGVDVVGIDWTVDMADARARLGPNIAVQGNVDPAILFSSPTDVEEAIHNVVKKAGRTGHVLNLGHGVLVGTPEENVAHFFNTARSISYDEVATPASKSAVAA